MVDNHEEAMNAHRVADLGREFGATLRRSRLREVDDGQICPIDYEQWSVRTYEGSDCKSLRFSWVGGGGT